MYGRNSVAHRSCLLFLVCAGTFTITSTARAQVGPCQFQPGNVVRPTDLGSQDQYATSVDVYGNFAFIGAPRQPTASETGAVYVATRGLTWSVTQKLVAPDAAPGRRFGSSVAMDGSWAVVGSDGAGAAYAYQLVGSTWTYRQKLVPNPVTAGDLFGSSVAISGSTLVVGAHGHTGYSGRAFVFKYNGTSWVQTQVLAATDGAAYDFFGFSVGLSNNSLVVGAYGDDETAGTNFGSVYAFRFDGTQWVFQQKLHAPDGASGDNFGESVSVSGSTLVIGASRNDQVGSNAGAAYVFGLNGTQWNFASKLTGSDSAPGDWFGTSVATDGEIVVVGSPLWDSGEVTNCGAVYSFAFDGTRWVEQTKLLPPAPWGSYDDNLGKSVAINSGEIVGGANLADWQGRDTGDAYFFDVHCDEAVPECTVNGNCNDNNACTTDTCNSGRCVFTNNTLPCNDGVFCNGADTCNAGSCSVHAGNPCATGAVCANTCNEAADNCFTAANVACTADTNTCTNDVCDGSGACTHPFKPAGSPCGSSAAGLCDNPDTCNSTGVCLANNLPNNTTCTDDGNECTSDVCSAGQCTHPAKTDGTACTADTNSCTNDVCTFGACAHPNKSAGSACGSSAAGLCDNPDTCNASGVCLTNNLPNGSACADDGNECTTDTCNAGVCAHPTRPNGSTCNDGSAATSNDQCTSGLCAGTPQCVTNADCNDSNVCTTDTCVGGACQRVNNTVACADDGNVCTNDLCGGGACTHPAKANGTTCDDGLFCNGTDSCSAGACTVHAGNPCAGGPVCANTCNESSDNCFTAANTACTADTNACTNDVCNGSGTCTHPLKPGGSPCGSSAAGLCDNPDTCNASGVCLPNNLPNGSACLDDGNECTNDVCNAGQCIHPAKAANTPCNDGNVCTDVDYCSHGVCVGGSLLACDDGDPCTIDTCGPKGCRSVPMVCPTGQVCVDGICSPGILNPCGNGVCDASEDGCSCPRDCLTVAVLCGNGTCDVYAGENCRNCPDDCRGRLTGPANKHFCCGDAESVLPAPCDSNVCNSRDWSCTESPAPCP